MSFWGLSLLSAILLGVILFSPSFLPYTDLIEQPIPAAYAEEDGVPFVSEPVTPVEVLIDLSKLAVTITEPTEFKDHPIGETPILEDNMLATQGLNQGTSGDFNPFVSALSTSGKALSDFVSPQPQFAMAQGSFATPTLNIEGIPAAFVPEFGFTPFPPDPNGDVGPNHYIQTVNSRWAIFDKTGNTLAGPLFLNSLWVTAANNGQIPANDPCVTNNDGDPIVVYDHLADRWLLSQFVAFTNQCIAISMTSDPVNGGWFLYNFPTGGILNDYPKFGVWPDAYYMGTNAGYPGGHAWAFDRTNMLLGNPAIFIVFTLAGIPDTFMLPSHLDGPPPPAAAPNLFMRFVDGAEFGGVDRLELREFSVNFANPLSSTFTALPDLATAAFDSNFCGVFNFRIACIPQLGTDQLLDTLRGEPLYRLQYHNFGTHETVVVNHSVDMNGNDQAGIRWYELRKAGGVWSIFQQGDHSPDSTTSRWMGSIAMDKFGNMALGYTASSSNISPEIRYAGRLATDPAGTMPQGEFNILTGGSSQFNSNRWGDYSSMSVDPVDGCTFWYTHEYFNGNTNLWSTRIASFSFPECGRIVGGELLPIDTTALLLAGMQTNLAWILPVVLAGAGFAAFKLRRK